MKVFIVDAFTTEAFKGNPAAVCLLENKISEEKMQAIANEFNLSETIFLEKNNNNQTDYLVRYFTPTTEVVFCGHATLAAAKVILHHLGYPIVNFTTFHNLSLSAASEGENISMKFPLYDAVDFIPSKELLAAFGILNPISVKFAKDLDMLVIEVAGKAALLNIKPDFAKALQTNDAIKELVVTSKSEDKEYDFYSRCFCPWIGINEDPVTGAAHSVLAKYWSSVLGKREMMAYQSSKRGGFLKLKILSETELEVVSNAKIVVEGTMSIN
ncbi:PhzF family phenazine biosynthesis protein [Ferruginibacter sp.]|nr:PhzF family phenazine biosynthesis protein [Ferruginibacter sp.]